MKELETLIANVSATATVCAIYTTHKHLEAEDAAKAKLVEYVERCVKEARHVGCEATRREIDEAADRLKAFKAECDDRDDLQWGVWGTADDWSSGRTFTEALLDAVPTNTTERR